MSAPAAQTADREVELVLKRPRSSILLLESKFGLGGSERITYDVVRRLDVQRYRPVLCTLYEPGEVGEWFIRDGYRFYSRLITHRYDPRAFGKLRSIIQREHVELVFLINQPLTCFWGFIMSKYCRIPVVAGIWPLVSVRNAEFMKNELRVSVPDSIIERLARTTTPEAARAEGVVIAREMLSALRHIVQGAQISAPPRLFMVEGEAKVPRLSDFLRARPFFDPVDATAKEMDELPDSLLLYVSPEQTREETEID